MFYIYLFDVHSYTLKKFVKHSRQAQRQYENIWGVCSLKKLTGYCLMKCITTACHHYQAKSSLGT